MISHVDKIIEAKEGSKEAMMSLYDEHYLFIFQAVYRIVGNKMDAEDISHDAFLDAFNKLKSLKDSSKFKWWLKKIAINKSLERFRGPLKSKLEFDIPAENLEIQDAENWNSFNTEQILRASEELPEGYRLVFTLYLLENLSHDEIAEKLGIKVSASRSQLSRAKVKLKTLLEESYGRVER